MQRKWILGIIAWFVSIPSCWKLTWCFAWLCRYHTLHHTEKASNFCLFMPLYDLLGNTLNGKSWELQKQISLNARENEKVPDFVFLAHVVDISSAVHVPFMFRSFASMPYATRLFILPIWPIVFLVMFAMWAWASVFTVSFYNLRNRLHHTWVVPRFGFQVWYQELMYSLLFLN